MIADLHDVERIHIWRSPKGVQLNVKRIDSDGWSVTMGKTLEQCWTEQFDKQEEDDPLS